MSTLDFVEAVGGEEVPQWRRRLGIGGLDFIYDDDFMGGAIEVEPRRSSRPLRGVDAAIRPAPTGKRKTDRHEYITKLREIFTGEGELSDSDDDLYRQTRDFEKQDPPETKSEEKAPDVVENTTEEFSLAEFIEPSV